MTGPTATMVTVTLSGPGLGSGGVRVPGVPAAGGVLADGDGDGTADGDVAWNVSVGTLNASAAGPSESLNAVGVERDVHAGGAGGVCVGPGSGTCAPPMPVTVTANGTTSVAFIRAVRVDGGGEPGGSVSGAGTTWVASGDSGRRCRATPSTGYTFAGWDGTGTGASAPVLGNERGAAGDGERVRRTSRRRSCRFETRRRREARPRDRCRRWASWRCCWWSDWSWD